MVHFSEAQMFTQGLVQRISSLVQEVQRLKSEKNYIPTKIKSINDKHRLISIKNQSKIQKFDENRRKIKILKKKFEENNQMIVDLDKELQSSNDKSLENINEFFIDACPDVRRLGNLDRKCQKKIDIIEAEAFNDTREERDRLQKEKIILSQKNSELSTIRNKLTQFKTLFIEMRRKLDNIIL
jgi:myo-inositol-1-phosphate synthase